MLRLNCRFMLQVSPLLEHGNKILYWYIFFPDRLINYEALITDPDPQGISKSTYYFIFLCGNKFNNINDVNCIMNLLSWAKHGWPTIRLVIIQISRITAIINIHKYSCMQNVGNWWRKFKLHFPMLFPFMT